MGDVGLSQPKPIPKANQGVDGAMPSLRILVRFPSLNVLQGTSKEVVKVSGRGSRHRRCSQAAGREGRSSSLSVLTDTVARRPTSAMVLGHLSRRGGLSAWHLSTGRAESWRAPDRP